MVSHAAENQGCVVSNDANARGLPRVCGPCPVRIVVYYPTYRLNQKLQHKDDRRVLARRLVRFTGVVSGGQVSPGHSCGVIRDRICGGDISIGQRKK